ncbi:MAG: DUF1559 domain-containing protein [Fuerstiella sp.]
MKRRYKYALVLCVMVVLFLALLGMTFLVQVPYYIVAGWLHFLMGAIPAVTVDLSAVLLAAVALLVLVCGVHRAGRHWVKQQASGAAPEGHAAVGHGEVSVWRVRWTLSFVAGLLLVFTAGISVVGAVHQLVWIGTSSQPLTENSWDGIIGLVSSKNTLKNIGTAVFEYHDQTNAFPAGGTFNHLGRPMHSWAMALLPFLDHQSLYDSIDKKIPWNSPGNETHFRTPITEVQNEYLLRKEAPNSAFAPAHYAANQRVFSLGQSLSRQDITDGSANTIMLGEVATEIRAWGDPLNVRDPAIGINGHPNGFNSPYPGNRGDAVVFLMADGSTRTIRQTIDAEILQAISTPNGGEPVGEY